MKLTDEEKEVIKKLREEKESDKPYREAFLKHDLWTSDGFSRDFKIEIDIPRDISEEMTQEDVLMLTKLFQDSFKIILKKGERFVSSIYEGEELWDNYDSNYGIEEKDNKWAEKHLENFKVLRKRK